MTPPQQQWEDLVDDETLMSEITIQPDGRLYVFGTSREVLEVLDLLCPGDAHVARLLDQANLTESHASQLQRS
jgi:hypothetical protein